MLEIVRLALRRPYTFVVLAITIVLIGPLMTTRTPTDIFPDIGIPVISVVWSYNGLSPDEMSGRVITPFERGLSTTVNDIQKTESQSLNGYGIVKIFFQPSVDIRSANAQVTAYSQTVLKSMPPGITPPQIINYNASTVPILQLTLSSKIHTEAEIFDYANNFIKPVLSSVPGAAIPTPYGGKFRQVQIDVDPAKLQAKSISAQDLEIALAEQNQIIPVGTQKIGQYEYEVKLNNSPDLLDELNNLPIRVVKGIPILIRDVAHVRDGSPPQTNMVRVDGVHSVLMTILKTGSASTLNVVAGVYDKLPKIRESLPAGMEIHVIGDQSIFVRNAISGVAKEGVIAAALTSLMILLFLGSWRSTVIIAISIPLAVLAAIAGLSWTGETLNLMTLGGLALAVGVLVDDATVTIENINWHLEKGKKVQDAIMDGAQQIVTPALVSLLCICIVFLPMIFLSGISRFLFVPMAKSVVFAMVASFILSRTLVPTLANYLLRTIGHPHPHASHHQEYLMDSHGSQGENLNRSKNPLIRFQQGFEKRFSRFRAVYFSILKLAMHYKIQFISLFIGCIAATFLLLPWLGQNFFPDVDSNFIAIHVRAPVGTRLEETAASMDTVESFIRNVIPKRDLETIVDNIGLPVSGTNMAYSNTGSIGPQDGDILVALKENHRPNAEYIKELRLRLPQKFPGMVFAFLPADITSQILNFGSPAPIDLKVSGKDLQGNMRFAQSLLNEIKHVPGIADARIQQSTNRPQLKIFVDRSRAAQLGITERDITNSLVVDLAGSAQVAPAFWLNPRNGVNYAIVAQAPQDKLQSLSDLEDLPITGNARAPLQTLGGLATITRGHSNAVVSHANIQPTIDIYASTQNRDLGAVSDEIKRIVAKHQSELPKGSTAVLGGQAETMHSAFAELGFGLLGSIVLIYLLVVINFQSWSDPFVIITALPGALAGIVWMLFLTHSTLSVPALTGAIMCMGVATANSVLVISFARSRLHETGDPVISALEAGFTRFRPVLMTALAMIIGMAPMALGLGDGGEQNAPLGRAVIGGLIVATLATLIFVPVVFSIVHRNEKPQPNDTTAKDQEPGVQHA